MTKDFQAAYSCSGVQYHGARGPLNIDYYHLCKCEFKDLEPLFLVMIAIWILILINLLAKIASEYFTPTLSAISLKWQLSDNFAGLTLLALANGAPDVFCVIITGNSDLGISALLGGGLFVSSVVVGCIAILCPCKLRGLYFTRDVLFLLISVTAVTVLGTYETVTQSSAISLIGIYITYLFVVLQTPWIERIFFQKYANQPEEDSLGLVGLDYLKKIEAAQWTHDEEKGSGGSGNNSEECSGGEYSEMITTGPSECSKSNENDLIRGYKFTILENYASDENKNDENRKNRSENDSKNDNKNENRNGRNRNDRIQNDVTVKETSSGYVFNNSFSGKIIEEFHLSSNTNNSNKVSLTGNGNGNEKQKYPDTVLNDDSSKLRESLLSKSQEGNENESKNESENDNENENENDVQSSSISKLKIKLEKCCKICFRCGYVIRPQREWSGIMYKIVQCIEMPVVFLMNITIATSEVSVWCKEFAVIQPLLAPFFTLFAFGSVSDIFSIPFLLFYVTFCATTSFCILIFAHHSYPPQHTLFVHIWLIFGFFVCIVWLYLLSGELVYCLTSIGRILDIPTFYLGLTILAWGNSIGDLFSDISIAKMGLGEMALAGCYGGPIFNILIGMGTSLSMICYHNNPKPYQFTLDASAYISIGFLFVSLISTVLITAFHRFHITAYTGYYLIVLYVVYTLTQTFLALSL